MTGSDWADLMDCLMEAMMARSTEAMMARLKETMKVPLTEDASVLLKNGMQEKPEIISRTATETIPLRRRPVQVHVECAA